MKKCSSISKDHIDYNYYYCLNDKFYDCKVVEAAKPYFNQALDSTFRNIPKFSETKKLLEWILKHLSCTRVFYDGFINMPCKYINYLLNKEVRGLYPYDYSLNFEIFKKFAENFYSVVEGYNNFKSCMNNIKLLDDDDDEHKKMDMLYKLYKKYDELKMINEWSYNENSCEIIEYITILANDVARRYEVDDEFIKVLRDLRDKIKNGTEKYQKLCESDIKLLDTMVTEKAFPPRKTDHPPAKDTSPSTDSLEQPTRQALAHASEKGVGYPPEPEVDLPERLPTDELASKDHLTQVPHVVSPPEASHHLEESIVTQHSRGSHHASSRHTENLHEGGFNSGPFSRAQYGRSHDVHSNLMYTQYTPGEDGITTDGIKTPTEGTQSYLETFKGTITGVLGSVDPGPEEEDVSDKFPVLSMDHSQDISQIFMNMKVGILDMEQ
ncbi:hypothetical protein PVIIG_06190 [Plasmodium vivax India VII]|uniref:Uncharacterized protein n=1 Tax=Plasmodium vivax India VII TaxID=1077284 RepID=A0A0J9S4P6_PLAVI|nr:hypothetical protein PVIIG_06190 [Plasmodium vivax India VII]